MAPNSLDGEDNLLRLDATLAGFLAFVDQAVELNHALIVLSADHGVDDIPEARRAQGFAADRFHPAKVKQAANDALKIRFAIEPDFVAAFTPLGFHLDRAKLAGLKLDPVAVETALAEFLHTVPGIAHPLTQTDLPAGRVTHILLLDMVQRGFHPTRSGDVVIVQQQLWHLYPEAGVTPRWTASPRVPVPPG